MINKIYYFLRFTISLTLAIILRDLYSTKILGSSNPKTDNQFTGITLAHNVKYKNEVNEILELAKNSGGKIVKEAQDTFWGGYAGYFSDPDGHLWDVAYSDSWKFNPDGSLIIE